MKINTKSTFGNFLVEAEAEISNEQRDELAAFGFKWLLQRSPFSGAEKVIAGYEKRPSGFKRDSIDYSEAKAEQLVAELQKPIEIVEGIEKLQASVLVTEYVPTVADVKMTDERNAYAKAGAEGRLASVATKVGFKGEVGDGTKENAPVDFLRAIRAWKNAQLAELA